MNKELMFSSKKEDWETPQLFFNELNKKYKFNWDLASSDANAKCVNHFTVGDDSLSQDWSALEGNLWLNPPYGRDLKHWVKKAYESSLDRSGLLVMLIPSRTDTSYWHDYIFDKAQIKFIRGRLKFENGGVASQPAPFPSALIVYGKTFDD
ncbi:phage N-6-adenine-methyltransferase [Latilactobacillus sakei]|uniref:DNA N-6-adenine-methyltransferase n=1 Tax=Latilactobacillus sakei TaxID=1599 RepID=UPI0038F7D504